ncbi:MAG: DUF6125 family protein [Proteobacteria bacterium]|nr:DUF6125 family protein [Pseudomonadota bacterium]
MSKSFKNMSKDMLIEILGDFAANWLAHDGSWFLAAEKEHGLDKAISLDREAWREFSPVEARRIMKRHGIAAGGGLGALKKALGLRMYALLNKQEITDETPGSFVFRMVDCRVQSARRRKKLTDFPCQSVGVVEYAEFAKAIDPRIKCECIACPPDDVKRDYFCAWRFSLGE